MDAVASRGDGMGGIMHGTGRLRRHIALFIVALFAAVCLSATPAPADVLGGRPAASIAKKKKKRKKKRRKRRRRRRRKKAKKVEQAPPAAEAVAPAPPPPPTKTPAASAPAAAAPGAAAGAPVVAPHAVVPTTPAPVPASTRPPIGAMPTHEAPRVYGPEEPLWGGFFLSLNVGYSNCGGQAGPLIPQPRGGSLNGTLSLGGVAWKDWPQQPCTGLFESHCYSGAVTTDVGAGLAAAFQVGYNVAGYVSFWGDISWHGSFGSKSDTAGAGTAAIMIGLHPLRFWRPDAPFDLRLYGGFGFFEILYYYETHLDVANEPKGKSWLGTSIPFGLSFEYRIPDSVFAMGVDLRFVSGAYDEWVYNYDNDQKSALSPPITTFRFEPRVVMGWHF